MGQAATLPCRRGTFLNECPSGLITLHEFQRHFCNGTVGKGLAEYAGQMFRTLDNNGDGVVDFREHVSAISIHQYGSLIPQQGFLLSSVAASFNEPNPLTANKCTNRIFFQLDKDSNAVISLEEFIEGALDDEWTREMLECDPNIVKVNWPTKGHNHLE
uniref:EF-hand domain-containing protein n=1 Tax=Esox lucius TaxID=8010 RepID=A0A3P8Z9Z7_ESOLU